MKPRLLGALLSALLLALSFPLTLLPLPTWLLGQLPFDLPADPALGSFAIPGLSTQLGYVQFPWMVFIALVPLLLSVRAARRSGEALLLGIGCGIVWLVLTMLWLVSFGFVPVLLLAIYFSLPLGLFTWLSWHLMHPPASRNLQVARLVWGLPLLWTAIEYLRSFGTWAFPWNFLGYTQAAYPMLAQTADIGGVYLVGFIVVLVNVTLVTLISSAGTAGLRARHVSLAALLLAGAFGYGWWRDKHPGPVTKDKPLTFELVQGGLSSREDWDDESYRKSLEAYAGTTRKLLGLNQSTTSPFYMRTYDPVSAVTPASDEAAVSMPRAGGPAAVKPGVIGPAVSVGSKPATPATPARPPVVKRVPFGDVLIVWPEGALLKKGGFELEPTGDGAPFEVKQLVESNPQHAVLWGALGFKPALDAPPVQQPPANVSRPSVYTPPPATTLTPLAPSKVEHKSPAAAAVRWPRSAANGPVVTRANPTESTRPVLKSANPPAKPLTDSSSKVGPLSHKSTTPNRTGSRPPNTNLPRIKKPAVPFTQKIKNYLRRPKRPKRIEPLSDLEQVRQRRLRLVNGCILTSSAGSSWPYSKIRLVPYGEVTPFRGIVTFLHFPWDFGGVDLNAGSEMNPVEWRGHKLGALICFDNIFGFIPRAEAKAGAQYLIVMTNNSWYPMHSGIRQHADIDVLRAIETRRPLLRCSTTGWSQVVDRNGRIIKSSTSRTDAPEIVEATMQPGKGTTPYMAVGDLFAQLCLLAALLICIPPLVAGSSEGFL